MGYWITSRYEGKCKECECDILPDDRIFYEPNEKSGYADVYCALCGEDADDAKDNEMELEVE